MWPDSVDDLIDDVVLRETEELNSAGVIVNKRIADKIISLPVVVCFGSSNVVLMDTK
jgi:hypothetical protein